MINQLLQLINTCFTFWKKFFETPEKKEFIANNGNIIKSYVIVFLSICLIVLIILYVMSLFKRNPIQTIIGNNTPIIVQLEVPANIEGPISIKVFKPSNTN